MKKHILLLLLLFVALLTHAQVKIGDNPTTIGNSSLLELENANKSLLITRVPSVESINNPVNGMIVYDIAMKCIRGYENDDWTGCFGAGTITTLNCAEATPTGTLTEAVPASGVSSAVTYTGGNGNAHTGQVVASTGITGLTATLTAGSFTTGAGTLTYNITGTPSAAGTASFALNIGGQTCTLEWVVGSQIPANLLGSGSLSGKLCFDINESNFTNGCGTEASRQPLEDNFMDISSYQQTYTFKPSGTVSNVRFAFINIVGTPIVSISGGNPGNNINSAVVATVLYSQTLDVDALGTTNSNPHTADIYAIYNDAPDGTGTDRYIKVTPMIRDCACCSAYVSATKIKQFLCHNLGADITFDPNVGRVEIFGANVVWGRRGPSPTNNPANISGLTGDSRYDWQTYPNAKDIGFVAAPTSSDPNTTITNWDPSLFVPSATPTDWNTGTEANPVKSDTDPCPTGWRIPTAAEMLGVQFNNDFFASGTENDSQTNYSLMTHVAPKGSTNITLSFPATGTYFKSYGTPFSVPLKNQYRGTEATYSTSLYLENTYASSYNIGYDGYMEADDSTQGFHQPVPIRCISEN